VTAKTISSTVQTFDPQLRRMKPRRLRATLSSDEGTVENSSQHQTHRISFAQGESDWVLTIEEFWPSKAGATAARPYRYAATREVSFTTLVHALLNMTDAELADMAQRTVDMHGQSTIPKVE